MGLVWRGAEYLQACRLVEQIKENELERAAGQISYFRLNLRFTEDAGCAIHSSSKTRSADANYHFRNLISVKAVVLECVVISPRRVVHMASKLTAGDLQIITRIAVFRGLRRETIEHIIAPATATMLQPRKWLTRQGDQTLTDIAKRMLVNGAAAKANWGREMALIREFGSNFFCESGCGDTPFL